MHARSKSRGPDGRSHAKPQPSHRRVRHARLGLPQKFALFAATLVAGTAIALGWQLYSITEETLLAQEKERLAYRLEGAGLAGNLQDLRRNLRLLANTPSLRTFVDLDPDALGNGDPARIWKRQIAIAFTNMIAANPDYMQIRFIGVEDEGREVVRVERSGETIKQVEEAALQRKGDRHYVRKAFDLPPGATYLSRIELNREHGAVVEPHWPTMRAATPVTNGQNTPVGILVINVDARVWLKELATSVAADHTVYVTDENGDYLLHPDSERTFGFDLGLHHRLVDDLPELAPIYASDGARQLSVVTQSRLAHALRVPLGDTLASPYLVIAATTPLKVALLGASRMRASTIATTAVMVIAGAFIAVFFSGFIAKPLERLTLAVQRVTAGNGYDESILPDAPNDEVGILTDAFRGMMRAVTEREASLRALEKRTSAIFESAGNAIVVFDDEGSIERTNQSAQTMFGFGAEELAAIKVSQLMAPSERRRYEGALNRIRRDDGIGRLGRGREVVAQRKDGSTFSAHLTLTNLGRNRRTTLIAVIADLTEMKKVEKMKDEFVSTVSHELRTPLTSIKGSLSLLKSEVTGALPAKAQAMINIAYNNSNLLMHLINDILDLEKIESGKMRFDFRPVNVAALMCQAKDTCKAFTDQCGVRIELGRLPARLMVSADPDRLMQVLSNLISNAAKFSPEGKAVTLSAARKGDSVRICVADRGQGIPKEFRSRVFAKFAQADSSDAGRQPGTGLGLSISKAIVEAHGGMIAFDSDDAAGTTFHFDLPARPASNGKKRTGNRRPPPKVLICEDDPHVGALLEMLVCDIGFDAEVASTAQTALNRLRSGEFVAATLDLSLPDGSGIGLVRELRGRPETQDLPIVIVSAAAARNRRKLKGGAFRIVDWLEKPIDPELLRASLKRAVRTRRPGRPLILHVEDDADHRSIVSRIVADTADLEWAVTFADAKAKIADKRYDLVILDLNLRDGNGEDLLPLICAGSAHAPPVLVFSISELPRSLLAQVDSALVKSKTNNDVLQRQIKTLLRTGKESREIAVLH